MPEKVCEPSERHECSYCFHERKASPHLLFSALSLRLIPTYSVFREHAKPLVHSFPRPKGTEGEVCPTPCSCSTLTHRPMKPAVLKRQSLHYNLHPKKRCSSFLFAIKCVISNAQLLMFCLNSVLMTDGGEQTPV